MIADAGRGEYWDLAQRRGERGENRGLGAVYCVLCGDDGGCNN